MIHKKNKYGYIKPKIDKGHRVFGAINSVPKIVLNEDGQWDKFLPNYESQNINYETYGCTIWGTQNCIETLENRLDNTSPNYSERYNYILANVTPPGADVHYICDSIRQFGLVPEAILDMPNTYEEFLTPNPMTNEYLDVGKKWLNNWEFSHEWVFTDELNANVRIAKMKDALRYSPIGVSVTAWYEQDGIYIDNNEPNNHWCECYGYTEANGQVFWKIFDSYDNSHKILHPEHHIEVCKMIGLRKKDKPTLCGRLKKWYNNIHG